MGNKAGYADTILRVLGLRPGQGADAYLWCEPDPGCRLLLEAYRSPALARGAAEVLRGWAGEEPRALWERLRAEGPPVLEPLTAYEVARWIWLCGRSFNTVGPDAGFLPSESANGVAVWNAHPPEYYASRCDLLPALPATIAPDLRDVAPIPGALLYFDPPYADTSGYTHDLPRADVLAIARRWRDAGATVAISEAVPLPLPGWHHVRIDGERVGQKRTFSRQQEEWLTLSRPPAWVPAVQGSLFGSCVRASGAPSPPEAS